MKVRLCGTDEVAESCMLQVKVLGHEPFAVYNINGTYYVTADTCTHGKASLADEGELDVEECSIICTWHDGKFDVRTGAVLAAPCTHPIKTYPVTLEADAVWIDIE